ncbi:uncharacterized protein si:ch211-67f24.7 isoform X2 [Phyllopteryx taeniolatus]|uniref:uncharacterized protein si:ch211-67f24.7 isoform X2 n=1 Tax=Phyllopteryx taeniolatus TaxID=161469 RepID=UPI002AD57D54|nr:uncharacterized protein si:ch211-67f24.7 isoform X2 [Phyllopteryx taeniolatus]XP_061651069.1 uncharacterized protein si:ch211-67f24.7 isoform X2 [Phyllopteryx taeniolatus]
MKPQEVELVTEISKCMVSELKMGFTGALLELAQIQHGDSVLRDELEENRRRCREKARCLEVLVESLREELGVMRCQVVALRSDVQRHQQDAKSTAATHTETDPAEACRGKVLLHCFLQGLKAGLTEGTDARQQVALQLLHSEWEYVCTLNRLHDKYKTTTPSRHMTTEPRETFASFVERLLQRHLLFRNTLQERLSAQQWKCLVGDVLVRLVGQNDTSFADAYVGYTGALASFLSLEVHKLDAHEEKQGGQAEKGKEQIQVLSLLLAPVSRVHCYLSHIQNLLQWTGKEHPDCSLLLGAERTLRDILSRCHVILEEDVRWDRGEGPRRRSLGDAVAGGSSANSAPQRTKRDFAAPRESQRVSGLTNGSGEDRTMRVECWSCSPVRRQSRQCAPARGGLLTPEPAGRWAEDSDSGRRGDPDDTSAFDDSSVTSCRGDEDEEEEEEEEEDSQVPVLLKPSSQQRSERSVCLRWQIPRRTPHPPLRIPANTLTPASSRGKRLVTVRTGSPPLRAKSAFRPIWDNPTKQAQVSPEKEHRGFVPVQTATRPNFVTLREQLRAGQGPGLGLGLGLVQPPPPSLSLAPPSGQLWEDSEDSEGPCSTV